MPNIEFLTEKRFTLSTHLIEVAVKSHLSLTEFLFLMYFEDAVDKTFNISGIGKVLSLKEEDVLEAFNHLLTLNLIEVDTIKDSLNKHCEAISLDPLYKMICDEKNELKQNESKENIFDIFQKELGRNISPMEYEIINAWLEKGFSDDLVVGALEEAVYNGVSSLRYIDKILYEWQKKGFKKMTEVKGNIEKRREKENGLELFDYNWLEDEG